MSTPGYRELMDEFSGCSFEGGLYRVHELATGIAGQKLAVAGFPELAGRVSVFGFDWLGTQAALDFGRMRDEAPQVLLLEPGTGQALEVPVDVVRFHDEEIVDRRDSALASHFFAEWLDANPTNPGLKFRECVGYRVPLFLGGTDTIDNLELVDFEVYWDLLGQLRGQARPLASGTRIERVSRSDS